MKSQQIRVLLHVFGGVIQDAIQAFPELKESFLKDYERVALYCGDRGLALFTLDLPCLDSLLLRGLDSGRLTLEGPLSHRVSKRAQVPRLFSGLWLRIFHKDSSLKQDVDVTAVAFLRQLTRLGAKLFVGCSDSRIQATIGNYHDIEEELRHPSASWEADALDEASVQDLDLCDLGYRTSSDGRMHDQQGELFVHLGGRQADLSLRDFIFLQRCQRVADFVVDALGPLDPLFYSWTRDKDSKGIGFKHGPGAVSNRLKNWEKSRFPNWSKKLEGRFRFGVSAVCANDDRAQPLNHELPSRLICVPKSAKAPRLIAAEPVEHQWCQQLIWSWMRGRVDSLFKGYFLDFRNQKASSDLVLQSSRDQSLVTVDLSDASDRLSCWTVERMFRRNYSVLSALHAARTRWIRDDISSNGSFIKLKKFASQGTATTFPVQSIVFLIIALASAIGYEEDVNWKTIWKYRDQVRVYGDDIIIPRHGYVRLLRIMELLQLKVNVAKSYANGGFRESCGVHGYLGYDVTPCMPKTIVADGPASVVAVVDTTNNLFYKGYWNASQRLWDTVPVRIKRNIRTVGPADAGYFGLSSYSGSCEHHLKSRWHTSLHRFEVRTLRISKCSGKQNRGDYDTFLDFCSRQHDPSSARVVSEYARSRRAKMALTWESTTESFDPAHCLSRYPVQVLRGKGRRISHPSSSSSRVLVSDYFERYFA